MGKGKLKGSVGEGVRRISREGRGKRISWQGRQEDHLGRERENDQLEKELGGSKGKGEGLYCIHEYRVLSR